MEDMLTPPADRPRPRPLRLVLLMGMTALLYLTIFGGITHPDHRPVMTAGVSARG
jgi:hypothetical protein